MRMNINFRKNFSLLAVLLAVCTASTVMADTAESAKAKSEKDAPITLTSLKASRAKLKTLGRKIKDPDIQNKIKAALKSTEMVLRAGINASPEKVRKAHSIMQQLLTATYQNDVLHVSHNHSGSSGQCDICGDIGKIESEFKNCCVDIKRDLAEILTFLETQFPCSNEMAISNVPIIITAPGKYCVTRDLTYNGPGTAITVTADNVSINFENHSLTLTDSAAQGIVALNVSEFTLENDIIQGASIFRSPTSAAVHLINVQKATINNIYTKNTTRGIEIENSSDVLVQYSHVEAHEGIVQINFPSPATLAGSGNGGGIWINGSTGVTIDSCAFVGADLTFDPSRTSFGLHIEGDSRDIIVTNDTFTNWLGTIQVLNVTGLLIDHCIAVASPISNLNIVQLGSCDPTNNANDVTIQNSNFTQTTAVQGFDGFLILGGSGCLLENLLIDTSSLDIPNGYLPAAVHFGMPACTPYTNLVARDCIIKGSNGRTVYIEVGDKITLDECQISGGTNVNVYLLDATSCVVKNSNIFNGDSGIFIDNGAGGDKNSIENCLVYDNTVNGIVVADQKANHLSGNSVWGSRSGISLSFAGFTETYFNTSCNNSVHNCTNVSPSQVPGASPAVAGSNVCCNPQ